MSNTDAIIRMLRERISIAALVGETVDLAQTGAELRGECTAHRDRERGLIVHDATGLYQCLSCGRHGDVVQWTRETARCSEEGAIEILRNRAGPQRLDG